MADKERISRPSSGSNELGTETKEDRITGGLSAGTDTQLNLTAAGGKKDSDKKNKDDKNVNHSKDPAENTRFFQIDDPDE